MLCYAEAGTVEKLLNARADGKSTRESTIRKVQSMRESIRRQVPSTSDSMLDRYTRQSETKHTAAPFTFFILAKRLRLSIQASTPLKPGCRPYSRSRAPNARKTKKTSCLINRSYFAPRSILMVPIGGPRERLHHHLEGAVSTEGAVFPSQARNP